MTSVLNYFGYKGNPTPPPEDEQKPAKKAAVRALPAPWYTSREMYELERRAIFSRRWLLTTHSNRLKEPGDFVRYHVAGYDFILTKDRNNKINALHNVCRHRAYPVVEKPEGKAKILACRYHGWSYALDGKLAKAPGYQDIDEYDKSKNGMFPIHTRVDSKGFIWINMDAKQTPEVSWEEDFEDVDNQERFEQFDFSEYNLDHTYEMEGAYNWKILADNFNECYHCPTTHPDIPQFLNVDHIDVATKDGHMEHDHASTPEQKAQGFNVNSTYYFPNVSMSVS